MSPITHRWISLVAVVASLVGTGCAAIPDEGDSAELTGADETTAAGEHAVTDAIPVGSTLRATANVNLRTGASQSYSILHVVPEGSTVEVVASAPKGGYYKIKHAGTIGWSFGKYYQLASQPSDDGGGSDPADSNPSDPPSGNAREDAISRAKSAVGFSYWWGHGKFREEGPSASTAGSCKGSCPSCSHYGKYGGDCSGLVTKVWQVGQDDALSSDEHPYSTAEFNVSTSQWKKISRSSIERADAMVYRSGSSGHIFLYAKGDAWGSMYAYECKGCSAGCVYDLRTASGSYHAIRRSGY
jgi:uncharacterized protein YraI